MSLDGTYDDGNIFAKILRGEMPSARVFEDSHVYAFMDVFPQARGHTLVIPKHSTARNLLEEDPAVLGPLILGVQRVTRAVRAALKPDGIVVTQFNGAPAGQTVYHLHFHIIPRWEGQGLSMREGQQYHWENAGYADFDAFLAALSSGRRKTIRRERRDAQAAVEILPLTGADLTEEHWDAFHGFYMDTGSRKWGRPYLNRLFFSLLGERMADRVLLVMARREGRWVAGALNLIGGDCLYGRNWGCVEDIPFLHFELCYYQAIEWAIGRGLARVEAGAQGQHKIARGYLPSPVRSAHFIADPMLRGPVEDFVAREREAVEGEMEWLAEEFSPFRQES